MATKSVPTEKMGGAQDFSLISKFTYGYRNREDITVLPPGVLVTGSQNVLTNTFERVGIRKGYTLDGQANTDIAPIGGTHGAMGVFDWQTAKGAERNVRAGFLTSAGNDGKMQFRHVKSDGTIEWLDILTGLDSVDFNYISFWDSTEFIQLMLAVNGTSNIFEWNGAETTLLSATNTAGIIGSITLNPNADGGINSQQSGGVNYVVGNVLTVAAGNNNALITVEAVSAGAINATSINAAGTGYGINDYIAISGVAPGGGMALIQVNTVGGSGEVLTYTMIHNGLGYSVANGVATTSSPGTGFKIDIGSIGNGIISWKFVTDANLGSGYSVADWVPMTGGGGSNAHVQIGSVMSGTITKTGTETWAQAGFVMNSLTRRELIINGVTYTYGDVFDFQLGDTTTLYGVTPDPSAIPVGSLIVQAPHIYANTGLTTGLPLTFKNDLIATLQQRLYFGSLTDSRIWVSSINANSPNPGAHFNPTACWGTSFVQNYGSPLQFTTTSPPTAFIPQEEFIYISAGKDEWYNVQLNVDLNSATLNTNPVVPPVESLTITRLSTTSRQASQSQAGTNKIANSIVFLSFEPIIETYGRVNNVVLTPQMTDLSYPIVNGMNGYDFTNACVFYYRKYVYIAVPHEGIVLIYNMTNPTNPYWEAPQIMPISRFSVIGGDLYGHSSLVSETYKLFNGTNDNGFSILARASFSFNNYGTRSQTKGYNEFYVEGYISFNTTLNLGIQYDIDGCATNTYFKILGSDTQIVCITSDQASLGKTSLGKHPLGSGIITNPMASTPKFRVIKTFPTDYFYEDQVSFFSEDIDEQWEIIGFGPQLLAGGSLNSNITQ